MVVPLVWRRLQGNNRVRKYPKMKDQIAILLQNLKKKNLHRNLRTQTMSPTKILNQNDRQRRRQDLVVDAEYGETPDLKGKLNCTKDVNFGVGLDN